MSAPYINQLPNLLTTLRLFLAVPVCLLIFRHEYLAVLLVAGLAGFTDVIDGWLARKLGAQSDYGAVLDPVSDKALLITAFISLTLVQAIPLVITAIVVLRDLVIITGALCYRWLIGRYQMAPSLWGKANTLAQLLFMLMIIVQQIQPIFSSTLLHFAAMMVIGLALISGGNYVAVWSRKAWESHQSR